MASSMSAIRRLTRRYNLDAVISAARGSADLTHSGVMEFTSRKVRRWGAQERLLANIAFITAEISRRRLPWGKPQWTAAAVAA